MLPITPPASTQVLTRLNSSTIPLASQLSPPVPSCSHRPLLPLLPSPPYASFVSVVTNCSSVPSAVFQQTAAAAAAATATAIQRCAGTFPASPLRASTPAGPHLATSLPTGRRPPADSPALVLLLATSLHTVPVPVPDPANKPLLETRTLPTAIQMTVSCPTPSTPSIHLVTCPNRPSRRPPLPMSSTSARSQDTQQCRSRLPPAFLLVAERSSMRQPARLLLGYVHGFSRLLVFLSWFVSCLPLQ